MKLVPKHWGEKWNVTTFIGLDERFAKAQPIGNFVSFLAML